MPSSRQPDPGPVQQAEAASQDASTSHTPVTGRLWEKAKQRFGRFKTAAVDATVRRISDAATEITGVAQSLSENDKEWEAFGDYVSEHVSIVLRFMSRPEMQEKSVGDPVGRLIETLEKILKDARSYRDLPTIEQLRALSTTQHLTVKAMRDDLERTLSLFYLVFSVSNKLDGIALSRTITDMEAKMEEYFAQQNPLPEVIRNLPFAEGADWNPDLTCLDGTRRDLLNEVTDWLHQPNTDAGAKVFWLTGVAGSGKTTIAHTVSKEAHDSGTDVFSFFFDHNDTARCKSTQLILNLTRALASLGKNRANAIASVLYGDATLPSSSSATKQFQELIVKTSPSDQLSQEPFLMVLDALDECQESQDSLRKILVSGTLSLPPHFRIFVTSRPLAHCPPESPHITHRSIDLNSPENQTDVGTYLSHQLDTIAQKKLKGSPWPEDRTMAFLCHRSCGLFLWASTLIGVLDRAINPDRHLKAVLSLKDPPTVEGAMDDLYAMVLSACPWEDEDFQRAYQTYVGMIAVAREPLPIPAMQQLSDMPDIHPRVILQTFGSLLSNYASDDEPVRPSHSSFLDYVRYRADEHRLDLRAAHTDLALGCIKLLNDELVQDRTGILFEASLQVSGGLCHASVASPRVKTIPQPKAQVYKISASFSSATARIQPLVATHAFFYACSHWIGHLQHCPSPATTLLQQLGSLLTHDRLLLWIAAYEVAQKGHYRRVLQVEGAHSYMTTRPLESLLAWLSDHKTHIPELFNKVHCARLAESLETLCQWFIYYEEHKECYTGFTDTAAGSLSDASVTIRRVLSDPASPSTLLLLANALKTQAEVLRYGRPDSGALEEAIQIYRELSQNGPEDRLRLAACLSKASREAFSAQHKYEEAIEADVCRCSLCGPSSATWCRSLQFLICHSILASTS
ncbi:hypothetical protein CALCODRAFT_254100 [Calocera cornea HHB12733]|uniref:NACHT domain-containing protein n=1 Tax=Calocera cornea HHB12733 TaxID=1353952 RepID=A0A165GM41_9BASI|nr:hypothetical protein CALCODRAFT_254100 [Calocera cornea HHB12733]